MNNRQRRFAGLDALRGIAALAVCLDHFASGSSGFLPPTSLINQFCGWVGYHGIFVFFVVSGFIIPLSLIRANYRLRAAPKYLLRRVVRIDPPYFASLLLELGLSVFLSRLPHYHTDPLKWYEILGHVGYLNDLLGWHWAIAVYWTLAIEFQYYLCISLSFPLVFSSSKLASNSAILLWSVSGLIFPYHALLFKYGALFALGFILCRHLERRSNWQEAFLLTIVALGNLWYTFGWLCVVVSLLTMTGIAFWKTPSAHWLFFGKISYSLYLVHGIVGFHLINGLAKFGFAHHPNGLVAWLVICTAFVCTVPAAWLFWYCVERPSHLMAQRLSTSSVLRRDATQIP